MKTERPRRFSSIATLVAIFWCFAYFGQVQTPIAFIGGTEIQRVQFVGIFYPLEQKEKLWPAKIITVKAKNKEWLFSIKRTRNFTSGRIDGGILQNLWPPILILRGPGNLIDPLLKPDIAGRRFDIQGNLYLADGILQVNSVTEVIEKKEKKE